MKTDRELLELAAISYSFELGEWDEKLGCWWDKDGMDTFNPLQDDGDALRLACALGLRVFPVARTASGAACSAIGDASGIRLAEVCDASLDACSATRRAITRAAAQIQLNKEQTNGK